MEASGQLDLVALSVELPADGSGRVRIGVGQRCGEEIGREGMAPESHPKPIPVPGPPAIERLSSDYAPMLSVYNMLS